MTAPVDAASESSSKDDRSKTEASSIDLEWEHEAGIISALFALYTLTPFRVFASIIQSFAVHAWLHFHQLIFRCDVLSL